MFQQADMIASDEFTSQYQKIIFEFIEIKYYKIKKNMEDLILSFFFNFNINFSYMSCYYRVSVW